MSRAGRIFWIAFLCVLVSAVRLIAAESADNLLAKYGQSAKDVTLRERIINDLVDMKDDGAKAIAKYYLNNNLKENDSLPLIDALGRIGTAEAVRALKSIISFSYFSTSDITNYKAFAKMVAVAPGEEVKPSPRRRVWELLPAGTRVVVTKINLMKPDDKVTESNKYNIISALNQLIMVYNFWNKEDFSGLELDAEGQDKLSRHRPGERKFAVGLGDLELARLNRLLLATSFPKIIIKGAPTNIYRHRGNLYQAGLKALSTINLPEAREILFTFKPQGSDDQMTLIRALAKVETADASRMLVDYLDTIDMAPSMAARRALVSRIKAQNESGVERKLSYLIDSLGDVSKDKFLRHVALNALQVAACLSGDDGKDMFRDCLEDDNEDLRFAALDILAQNPSLISDPEIIIGVKETLRLENLREDQAIKVKNQLRILDILQKAKSDKTLSLVVEFLDSKERKVAVRATEVMRAITGRNLGRNPINWKKWYESEGARR